MLGPGIEGSFFFFYSTSLAMNPSCVVNLEVFSTLLPEANKFHCFHTTRSNGFCMNPVSEMFWCLCTISLKPLLPMREVPRESDHIMPIFEWYPIISCMPVTPSGISPETLALLPIFLVSTGEGLFLIGLQIN